MTKELLPSQIGCIDLVWLKEQIEKVNNGLISSTEVLQYLSNNIFPISPLLEDAWNNGNDADGWHSFKDYLQSQIKIKQDARK